MHFKSARVISSLHVLPNSCVSDSHRKWLVKIKYGAVQMPKYTTHTIVFYFICIPHKKLNSYNLTMLIKNICKHMGMAEQKAAWMQGDEGSNAMRRLMFKLNISSLA